MSEPSAELSGPDPSDPGSPITVHLAGELIGDAGHPRVDAEVIAAVMQRDGQVARWLALQGVDERKLRHAFPAQ